MKKLKCAICGETISYRDALHIRAHEMTDIFSFKVQPEEHLDMCRSCWKKTFKRGADNIGGH